jgi:hypothetical protein
MDVLYVICYLDQDGRWQVHQTFDNPLEADRAFQPIERLRPCARGGWCG